MQEQRPTLAAPRLELPLYGLERVRKRHLVARPEQSPHFPPDRDRWMFRRWRLGGHVIGTAAFAILAAALAACPHSPLFCLHCFHPLAAVYGSGDASTVWV